MMTEAEIKAETTCMEQIMAKIPPPDEPEIVEQSELDHFCVVLQCTQQIVVQLEKEQNKSKKRKTPKQYTGNSQKTLSRHKQARLQLEEKGFLGVFEFLELQKQTAAKKARNRAQDRARGDLTQEQSVKDLERPVQEEEESSPEDDAVEVDMTAAAVMMPINVTTTTPTSATSANLEPAGIHTGTNVILLTTGAITMAAVVEIEDVGVDLEAVAGEGLGTTEVEEMGKDMGEDDDLNGLESGPASKVVRVTLETAQHGLMEVGAGPGSR
jgi:hypothetical protein